MKKKVRANLIVIAILIIVIIMTIFFMILIQSQEKKALENKSNEFGLIVTEHASNTIEKWVSDQVSICNVIGRNGKVLDFLMEPTHLGKQKDAYDFLSDFNQQFSNIEDFIINIYREDEFELISHGRRFSINHGSVVLDSNNGINVGFSDIEDDYVRKIYYGYDFYISYLKNEMAMSNDMIMISVPIKVNDNLIGIASAVYSIDEVYNVTIGKIDISEQSDLALVDHDGNVIGSKFFTGINAFEKGGDFAYIAKQVQADKSHFHAMLLGNHIHFNAKPVLLLSESVYARWYVLFKQDFFEIEATTSALAKMLLITSIVVALCLGTIANILIKVSQNKAQKDGLLLAQAKLNEQIKARTNTLEDLSMRDSLTGAYNHKTIIDFLEDRLKINHNVSLIMLDLDLFKNVNDTHGHLIGDEVLIKISEVIQQSIEPTHRFGRYGGEEFLIVLPVTSLQSAIVLGEKLRKRIAGLSYSESELNVTASLGIIHCNDDLVKENIKKADELLYRAKKNGRNRIEWEVN